MNPFALPLGASALMMAVALPLLGVLLLFIPGCRPWVYRATPLVALPALWIATCAPDTEVLRLPSLLLGTAVQLDGLGRVMLLLTATVWFCSALHATGYLRDDTRKPLFYGFFLSAMAGNMILTVAADVVTFYTAFALMSFASYGLVVHTRTAAAKHAAWVYIVLVVLGEAIVFVPLANGAAHAHSLLISDVRSALAASPSAALMCILLLLGFGAKAGVFPLHVWLPLAHPAAPTPASAVLSGCMIKAGLLGWLRFLPLGEVLMPEVGTAVIGVALLTSFGALACGLTQNNPKALLAYSSIAKMGLLLLMIGLTLGSPAMAGPAVQAISLYALFHALNKGTLFLGCSVTPASCASTLCKRITQGALLVSAAAFAGAPLLAGAFAKTVFKKALPASLSFWDPVISTSLTLVAILTALLMARFAWLTWPGRDAGENHLPHHLPHRRERIAWLALLGAVLAYPVLLAHLGASSALIYTIKPAAVWNSVWPVALALAAAYVAWRRRMLKPFSVPAGDLLVVYTRVLRLGAQLLPGVVRAVRAVFGRPTSSALNIRMPEPWRRIAATRLASAEAALRQWLTIGMILLMVATAIMVLMQF